MGRNFSKKRTFRQVMQSTSSLIFLSVVVFIFAFNIFNFINKTKETARNKQIIEEKVAELENSKEKFNSEINKLKTERGVEESLREKFGVAKEGENMIMITENINETENEKETDSTGFFSWFRGLFE